MARVGLGSKAPILERTPEPKRTALLTSVVRHLEASAIDDALDLFSVRRLPTPCHSQRIAHRGPCGKTRVVPQNLQPKPEPAEIRDSRSTCALVDVWVSRDVEPPVGLAVRLWALGAEVRVCAPPDCAEQLADMQPC